MNEELLVKIKGEMSFFVERKKQAEILAQHTLKTSGLDLWEIVEIKEYKEDEVQNQELARSQETLSFTHKLCKALLKDFKKEGGYNLYSRETNEVIDLTSEEGSHVFIGFLIPILQKRIKELEKRGVEEE